MATVFMKWLERNPQSYDRGIRLLTLGRINRIQKEVVDGYVRQGIHVLEIGCGTGELACRMGEKGAQVTAIDIAPAMLAIAAERIKSADLSDQVEIRRMDSTVLDELDHNETFDLIVSSLLFSELSLNEQKLVLRNCAGLLKPNGRLILVDEQIPKNVLMRILFGLIRLPIAFITFLLTRTTTRRLRGVETFLQQTGYKIHEEKKYLGGTLCLYVTEPDPTLSKKKLNEFVPKLPSFSSVRRMLVGIWTLFFRIIPPYPKIPPGIYRVGNPTGDSPLLVTGNFELTLQDLVGSIQGVADVWILVVDTSGINVWCAAGGGFFTAEKIISALKANNVDVYLNHKEIVLPQLCANGVEAIRLREGSGWEIHWGPVRASDIPEYIGSGYKKDDRMRTVEFPIKDRLEMVSGTFGLYGLMFLFPIAVFWRHLFWPSLLAMAGLSYFYGLALPWLPGKDGLWKSIPMAIISVIGVFLFSALFDPVSGESLFNRAFGIGALAIFISGEFQGMSPKMRGEQANWIPEGIIAVILILIYWLTPIILGWR